MSLPSPDCADTKLRRMTRVVTQCYDAELGRVGLSTTRYWLLTEVLAHGPLRPCDLAKAMSLSPSTLTRNLKPLVSTGWLNLGAGIDGRTRSVCITTAGRAKCAEGLPHWNGAQARVHRLIGSQNVRSMQVLVEDCLTRMSAADG